MENYGVPAAQLSDEELERQGAYAHATRNWAFQHATDEQFQRHTLRMLELEQEYLRRHPKPSVQGDRGFVVDDAARLRKALRGLIVQLEALLDEDSGQVAVAVPPPPPASTAAMIANGAWAPEGPPGHALEERHPAHRAGSNNVPHDVPPGVPHGVPDVPHTVPSHRSVPVQNMRPRALPSGSDATRLRRGEHIARHAR
jgi:hypothetical protein